MDTDRQEDLRRGMRLIPELPEIMPDDASDRISPIYEDIQRTLRVPFVNFIFRVLANYPDYLEAAWRRLGPTLRTRAFEQAVDELRTQALLEPVPDAAGVAWESLGDMGRIRPFTDTIHYVLPKLLLVATVFDAHMPWARAEGRAPLHEGGAEPEIPLGVAEETAKIPMVDPKEAQGRLKELFEDIRRRHDHPGVASYYRSLGHWPAFLEAAWERVRPVVDSDAYRGRRRILANGAEESARGLRFIGVAGAGTPDVGGVTREDEEEIHAVLAVFRFKLIPDLLMDVALIKAMLDGRDAARRSRFSAAGPR